MKAEKVYFAEFKINWIWIKTECFDSEVIPIIVETALHKMGVKCRVIEKICQFNICT